MTLTTVKIADLQAHPDNYNRHPEPQLDALSKSLQEFGQFKNVVIRQGVILAGHGLVEAAKRQGLTEIAAVVRDDLTDEQAKALLIADNALPYGAEADVDALQRLLADLQGIEVPGVSDDWLESLGSYSESFEDFKRETFSDVSKDKASEKDGNWFFVTFYGDDDRFKTLSDLLKPHFLKGGPHEIDPDFFFEVIKKHNEI